MKPLYESIGNVVRQIYDMRIEGPPVLDVATSFPSAERFSYAWQSIRDEARAVAQQMHRVPRFHEIMREQTSISANDMRDWRMFILKAYGAEFPRNRAVCPTLAALVTASPDVLSASISFLAPGKHIPEHRGPFRGVLRFYLVLTMPLAADGRPAAVLKIAGTEHRLADGEYLLWDDTFPARGNQRQRRGPNGAAAGCVAARHAARHAAFVAPADIHRPCDGTSSWRW